MIRSSLPPEKLQEIFPDKTIGKFDRDSVTTQNKLKKILKEFNDSQVTLINGRKINILDIDRLKRISIAG